MLSSSSVSVSSAQRMLAAPASEASPQEERKEPSSVSCSAIDELRALTHTRSGEKGDQDRIARQVRMLLENRSQQLIGELVTATPSSQETWKEIASSVNNIWPNTHKHLKLNITTIAELADLLESGDTEKLENYLHADSHGKIATKLRSIQLPRDVLAVCAIPNPKMRALVFAHHINRDKIPLDQLNLGKDELFAIAPYLSYVDHEMLFSPEERKFDEGSADNGWTEKEKEDFLTLCGSHRQKTQVQDFVSDRSTPASRAQHEALHKLEQSIRTFPNGQTDEDFKKLFLSIAAIEPFAFSLENFPYLSQSVVRLDLFKELNDLDVRVVNLTLSPKLLATKFHGLVRATKHLRLNISPDKTASLPSEPLTSDEERLLFSHMQSFLKKFSTPNEKPLGLPDPFRPVQKQLNPIFRKLEFIDVNPADWIPLIMQNRPDPLFLDFERQPDLIRECLKLGVFKGLPVEDLNIESCPLTLEELKQVVTDLPNLKSLDASIAISSFGETLAYLIEHFPHLKINLSPSRIASGNDEKQHEFLCEMEKALQTLSKHPSELWDDHFISWFDSLMELNNKKTLTLNHCPILLSKIIKLKILKNLPLENLSITNCEIAPKVLQDIISAQPYCRITIHCKVQDFFENLSQLSSFLGDLVKLYVLPTNEKKKYLESVEEQHSLFCKIEQELLPKLLQEPRENWKTVFTCMLENVLNNRVFEHHLCLDNCPLLLRTFIELNLFENLKLNLIDLSINNCEISIEELKAVIATQPNLDCLRFYRSTETFGQNLVRLLPFLHLDSLHLPTMSKRPQSPEKLHELFCDMEQALIVLSAQPDPIWITYFELWCVALRNASCDKEFKEPFEPYMANYPLLYRKFIEFEVFGVKQSWNRQEALFRNMEEALPALSILSAEKREEYFKFWFDAVKEVCYKKNNHVLRMESCPLMLRKLIELDFFNSLNLKKLSVDMSNLSPKDLENVIQSRLNLSFLTLSCKAETFAENLALFSPALNYPFIDFCITPVESQSCEQQHELFCKMEQVLPTLLAQPNEYLLAILKNWFCTVVAATKDRNGLALNLENCPLLFSTILQLGIFKNFEINDLNIQGCKITPAELEQLAEAMPALETLAISIADKAVKDKLYELCPSAFKSLKELEPNIPFEWVFEWIVEMKTKLKHLVIMEVTD